MLPRVLQKDQFAKFVSFLMDRYRIVAPVAKGPQFSFERIPSTEAIGQIRMDYDQTILPPKKFFLPPYEQLLSFTGRTPENVSPAVNVTPTAILGVHPYDLHGLATTGAALCQAPLDPYYQTRREAAVLIGLNIKTYINEHQFMADMNTLEPPEGQFDLFLTDLGDRYYMEIGSETGSQLAQSSGCCESADTDDHQAKQTYDAEKIEHFFKRLPYNTRYLPELLDQSYDSLLWDAISQKCFSCGSCTNVCPTCYCFDVQDKLALDAAGGNRQRKWDSCQLKVFAEVAGGENFREHRASRLRHRMFRKGKFILERTGKLGCVGCGRCSLHCVVAISILEAFQQIADQAIVTES